MDLETRREFEEEQEQLRELRREEQRRNKDYSYEYDGRIELCDDCRSPINSHGHCPRCDY